MQTNVDGVVLAAEALSERDKRLTLFTRERGRLYARAAGAMRPGAKLSAATEPGVWGRFRLWLPEGAAGGRLTGGSVVDGHPGLRGDWHRMTSALFFCEWVDRLTPLLHAAPEKFDLLTRALSGLERHDTAVVRAAFLTQFARLAGYGPLPGVPSTDLDLWDFEVPVIAEIKNLWHGHPAREHVHGLEAHATSLREFLGTEANASSQVERQVIQFFSPLLTRPLRTLAHGRALDLFYKKNTTEFVTPR